MNSLRFFLLSLGIGTLLLATHYAFHGPFAPELLLGAPAELQLPRWMPLLP